MTDEIVWLTPEDLELDGIEIYIDVDSVEFCIMCEGQAFAVPYNVLKKAIAILEELS